MKWLRFTVCSALFAAGCMCVWAQTPLSCPTPADVTLIPTLKALPEPVRKVLESEARNIVEAGQPFDSTDAVRYGAHFNRFAFAWQKDDLYVLVTERGGFVYTNPIYAIRWKAGTDATLTAQRGARRSVVCPQAEEALRGSPGVQTPVQKKGTHTR